MSKKPADTRKSRRSISINNDDPATKYKRRSIVNPTLRSAGIIQIVDSEGKVVTPQMLNPLLYEKAKERPLFIYEGEDNPLVNKSFSSQCDVSRNTERSEAHRGSIGGSLLYTQQTEDIIAAMPEREGSGFIHEETFGDGNISLVREEHLPDMTHVSLRLTETNTMFVLDLPSWTEQKDSAGGAAAESDNRTYDYLTQGKGRNRKTVSAEVQTVPILSKSRETDSIVVRKKHNHAFASDWDMFDTYNKSDDPEDDFDPELDFLKTKVSQESIDSFMMSHEEKELLRLVRSKVFYDKLCIIERLLASTNFHVQQKRFRGLGDPSPFRENIEYKYTLNLLWTFSNDKTTGRCVTAVCWNKKNKDILAVAYGKFFYSEKTTGMIMLWNIKNPVQPERTYNFKEPVTSLDFSSINSNLLAAGFYDGRVLLLDVSGRQPNIIARSCHTCPSYEPIWQVVWYKDVDYFKGMEFLLTSCQDGRISKFKLVRDECMVYSHMMRVAVAEGNIKGLQKVKECPVPGISVIRYPAALVLRHHPADPNIYYVGTGDGVVHKCSKNYYHQHLDLFMAHDGPMYEIKFSPFCDKLFLTCGDDWTIRIWADGVAEYLFELRKTMTSVQGADWSPSHSTVIASICGSDIHIWDLQRKTYAPQSETRSPTKSRNTVVQFTMDGRCLLVGDIMGNVHMFALDSMPFPAMYQAHLLTTSVNKGLVTRPDLIAQLKKLGGLSFDKKLFQKHFK